MNSPCAASKVDPKLVVRPKGTKLASGDPAQMLSLGASLWSDTKLSTNGLSCNTCHQGGGAFKASFARPYPHGVAMARAQGGVRKVALDEMVQFCLVVPMAAKPLAWDSTELAALTAYTANVRKDFIASAESAKRGAGKNPRAAASPCAAQSNPCAAKR